MRGAGWVLVGLLACGSPTITQSDRDRHARSCPAGDAAEAKRVIDAVQGPSKARIIGVCALKSGTGFSYSVTSKTMNRERRERERVCDAVRPVVPTARLVVWDEVRNYSTVCGGRT